MQAIKASFLGLPVGRQPLVKGSDHGIEAGSHQSSHVESSPNLSTATPHLPVTPQGTTIPVEGSHPYQGSDLAAVEGAQFRQVGQDSEAQHRAYARSGPEEIILGTPGRAGADEVCEVSIQLLQSLNKPMDVLLHLGTDTAGSCGEAVLLSGDHLQQLAPAGQEGLQFPGSSIGQRDGEWDVPSRRTEPVPEHPDCQSWPVYRWLGRSPLPGGG